jgi:hypothetical protein
MKPDIEIAEKHMEKSISMFSVIISDEEILHQNLKTLLEGVCRGFYERRSKLP